MKRILLFGLALLVCGFAYAATDTRVDVTGFESDTDQGITISGTTIVDSGVYDPSGDKVPKHEGTYALYGEYDTTGISGNYNYTTISFPNPVDMTGMRELHFWIYFLPESKADQNGNYQLRVIGPGGLILGEPVIKETGKWIEIVLPINRWSSENSLSSFGTLQVIWLEGANNDAAGKFYIDEIYGFRKANTPAVKDVLVYGFDEKNAADNYPKGWTVRTDAVADGLKLGEGEVDPSEGTNYLVSVMPGGWKRPLETINSLKDFDQWDRVIDITADVQMSSDFNGGWHNFLLVIDSSAGGYKQYDIRAINTGATWQTVCWDVDMSPYLAAIKDPNGWLKISFVTQTGDTVTGSVYIDNLRVGLPTTYVGGTRSLSNNTTKGGDSFDVKLAFSADGDALSREIIETLPAGWTASAISDGGVAANGKITWNLSFTGEKSVTYKVTAPATLTADGTFDGTVAGLKILGASKISYLYPKLFELAVEAKYLSNSVTLDGVINAAEYAGANSYTFGHDNTKDNTAPGVHISGTSYPDNKEFVKFYVQHDANFIYVACDVTDPNLSFATSATEAWKDDSLELYLDGNLSRSNPYDASAYGPQMTVVGDGSFIGGQGVPTIVKGTGFSSSTDGAYWNFGARAKADGSGYAVEYKLDKTKMLLPLNRDYVGFDIMVNSSEKGATDRTGKWAWYASKIDGSVYEPWNDESGWGLMKLLPGTAVSDWSVF